MSTWEETSAVRRGQLSFRDAMARLDQSLVAQDGDRFFTSAVEAALWAVALNDHLHANWLIMGTGDQRRERTHSAGSSLGSEPVRP